LFINSLADWPTIQGSSPPKS